MSSLGAFLFGAALASALWLAALLLLRRADRIAKLPGGKGKVEVRHVPKDRR